MKISTTCSLWRTSRVHVHPSRWVLAYFLPTSLQSSVPSPLFVFLLVSPWTSRVRCSLLLDLFSSRPPSLHLTRPNRPGSTKTTLAHGKRKELMPDFVFRSCNSYIFILASQIDVKKYRQSEPRKILQGNFRLSMFHANFQKCLEILMSLAWASC